MRKCDAGNMLNWGNINDSTIVVEGSVLSVQWLVQHNKTLEHLMNVSQGVRRQGP